MYKPQLEPIEARDAAESRVAWTIMRIARFFVPVLARSLKFGKAGIINGERLFGAWKEFSAGKKRLILGFRHAYGDDPQLMAYFLHGVLPLAARRAGMPIKAFTHAHFIYGSEVPLWSHPFVGWLLPRVGAVPVNHANMDSKGMNRIRSLVTDGTFPLALAPEGHVTYDSERVREIETGTARFGFWAMEDLARKGRDEEVSFIPLSFHYRYAPSAKKTLDRLVARMEGICGIGAPVKNKTRDSLDVPQRLDSISGAILRLLASHYSSLSGTAVPETQEAVLGEAIRAAERIASVEARSGEDVMSRVYRVRNACWPRIVAKKGIRPAPCERALSSRACAEAWYAMRHMETAMMLHYLTLRETSRDLPFERLVERANNLFDLLQRIEGGTLKNRANEFKKLPIIVIGDEVSFNGYKALWKEDKKKALAEATEAMRSSFEKAVTDYRASFPIGGVTAP